MPVAAVILALVAYIKVVAVKKLVVGPGPRAGRPASPRAPAPAGGLRRGARACPSLGARGILQPRAGYCEKIRVFKAGPVSARIGQHGMAKEDARLRRHVGSAGPP